MKYLAIIGALLLSACVTSGAMGPVKYEPVVNHDKYQKVTLKWTGASRGLETRVYLRRINDGGQLRICAYYVDNITGLQQEFVKAWFDAAHFTHKGNEIISARFLIRQPKSFGAKAGCVTTKTLMKDVAFDNIYIKGKSVTFLY